ncbi:MAG: hypothetical protein ABJO02_01615 [Reichenbachiella sp.]|uniref:hypothetical protein n=1 Tax=Reichenbachiella sp. TaxID=2184521 RepID=UPI003296B989
MKRSEWIALIIVLIIVAFIVYQTWDDKEGEKSFYSRFNDQNEKLKKKIRDFNFQKSLKEKIERKAELIFRAITIVSITIITSVNYYFWTHGTDVFSLLENTGLLLGSGVVIISLIAFKEISVNRIARYIEAKIISLVMAWYGFDQLEYKKLKANLDSEELKGSKLNLLQSHSIEGATSGIYGS